MTAIIVLNWNGYQDTIDCLKSIYHIPSDFFVVVADNGSTDDSIPQIESFLHTSGIAYSIAQRGDCLKETPISRSCFLLRNGQNLGFARGNNAALRFCGQYLPEHQQSRCYLSHGVCSILPLLFSERKRGFAFRKLLLW